MKGLKTRFFLFITIFAALFPLALSAAEGNRNVLFQIGGGPGYPSYPDYIATVFDSVEASPSIDRIQIAIDIGLGIAVSQETYLMTRIDGTGDRFVDSIEYYQMNLYLYSIGIRHYPFVTGPYVEIGAGGSRAVEEATDLDPIATDMGFGYGAALGYDFNKDAQGFGLTMEARYNSLDIDGEQWSQLMLTLNLCWK